MADVSDPCTVLHVDMDAFYAAVEILDDPSLAGRPLIVGGSGTRGVVASCTYEARAYGIHSAMSSVEARRRCPHALFLEGRFWRYSEVSGLLHDVFHRFTPLVEPVALDEAFLDVSGARHVLRSSPAELADTVRRAVRDEIGLNCSVGAARSKLLAKLASEAAKPTASPDGPRPGRGVVVIAPHQELRFLHPLPVRALWGVGPATATRIAGLGVQTVGELAAVPEQTLCRLLGNAAGRHLVALARGVDPRPVEPSRPTKSIGHEETFADDLRDRQALHVHVVRMADAVSARLQEAGLKARTVTVKVRYRDRSTVTRSQSMVQATDGARTLRSLAGALLDTVEVRDGIRLLGVNASGLGDDGLSEQLSFDVLLGEPGGGDSPRDAPAGRWNEVEAAVAAVRARYGQDAVAPAVLVGRHGIDAKHRGDTQWGPSRSAEVGPRHRPWRPGGSVVGEEPVREDDPG